MGGGGGERVWGSGPGGCRCRRPRSSRTTPPTPRLSSPPLRGNKGENREHGSGVNSPHLRCWGGVQADWEAADRSCHPKPNPSSKPLDGYGEMKRGPGQGANSTSPPDRDREQRRRDLDANCSFNLFGPAIFLSWGKI